MTFSRIVVIAELSHLQHGCRHFLHLQSSWRATVELLCKAAGHEVHLELQQLRRNRPHNLIFIRRTVGRLTNIVRIGQLLRLLCGDDGVSSSSGSQRLLLGLEPVLRDGFGKPPPA